MDAVTLDRDEGVKLRVQTPHAAEAIVFKAHKPAPSGLSPISSITRAEAEARSLRHRPQLEPPKQHYMIPLLELHEKVEGTVTKELVLFKRQSQQDLEKIESIEKEKQEALKKHAEEAASRGHWGVLGTVAQYLTAGASVAVGLSIGPAGWGSLLITSGVIGLGNRVIQDTVGWHSVISWFTHSIDTQKKLVQRIEMGFLALELGTGLAGGFGAALTGSFSAISNISKLDRTRKTVAMLQTTSSVMTSTSRLGKTVFEKRMNDLQVRMRQLDIHAECVRMEMNQQVISTRAMIDMAQDTGKEMHKAVASSEIQDL